MRKFIVAASLAVAVMIATVYSAEGAFSARISGPAVKGSPITGGQGDGLEDIFVLTVSPPSFSGGLTFTSLPLLPGAAGETTIDTAGSISYTGTGTKTITIEVTRTNFSLGQDGHGVLATDFHLSKLTNATVTIQSWVNYYAGPGNVGNNAYNGAAIGGETPTGQAVGVANPTGSGLVSTYGMQTVTTPLPPGGYTTVTTLDGAMPTSAFAQPYSLTQLITITFNGNGSAISLDYGTTLSNPAPAGLLLALTGVPVLGLREWLRRRRNPVAAV